MCLSPVVVVLLKEQIHDSCTAGHADFCELIVKGTQQNRVVLGAYWLAGLGTCSPDLVRWFRSQGSHCKCCPCAVAGRGGVSEKKGRARLDTAPHPMRKKFCVSTGVTCPQQGQTIAAQGLRRFSGHGRVNFTGLVCVPAWLHLFPLSSFNGNRKAF